MYLFWVFEQRAFFFSFTLEYGHIKSHWSNIPGCLKQVKTPLGARLRWPCHWKRCWRSLWFGGDTQRGRGEFRQQEERRTADERLGSQDFSRSRQDKPELSAFVTSPHGHVRLEALQICPDMNPMTWGFILWRVLRSMTDGDVLV